MDTLYHLREFLNEEHGPAMMEARADLNSWGSGDKTTNSVDAHVYITDCNRGITLEFYFQYEEDYNKAIYKLDKLIDGLQKFRAALRKTGKLFKGIRKKEE